MPTIFRDFLLLCRILVVAAFLFAAPLLYGQHLLNDAAGIVTNSISGVIRLRAASGEVRNTNASVSSFTNAGIIEFLGMQNQFTGVTPTVALGNQRIWRIGGLVRYAPGNAEGGTPPNTQNVQNVQARWYANLELSGASTKRIADGVYVGGDTTSLVPPLGTGVYQVSGGTRIYAGTFFFDNTASQTIPGGEDYANIEVQRGKEVKRISAGTMVQTRGFFRQNGIHETSNPAGLLVLGALTIGTRGDFPATDGGDGAVTVIGGGSFTVGSDSAVFGVTMLRVASGSLQTSAPSGAIVIQTSCTLQLNDYGVTRGTLTLAGTNHTLVVNGVFANDAGDRTNTLFHAKSNVFYAAGSIANSTASGSQQPQEIVTTASTHPYGNLFTSGGDKRIGTAPDGTGRIHVVGNLSVSGGTLDVTANGGVELVLLNTAATVTYGRYGDEVRGAMRRMLAPQSGDYVFNNAETRFTRTDGFLPASMTFDVRGGLSPTGFQPDKDVKRRIVWSWVNPQSGSQEWTGTVRVSYKTDEVAPPFLFSNEAVLSLYENAENSVRLLGGRDFARQAVRTNTLGFNTLGYVQLGGISPADAAAPTPSVLTRFTSGREILLRGVRVAVRSIADGRWSNPGTWNIGREPDAADSVEILHAVHIGFRRNGIDGLVAGGQFRENNAPQGMATVITIGSSLDSTPDTTKNNPIHAALLIGFLNASEGAFADELAPNGSAWNLVAGSLRVNAGAAVTQPELITRAGLIDATFGARFNNRRDYRGLIIFQNPTTDTTSTVRAASVLNNGGIYNGGILEIR